MCRLSWKFYLKGWWNESNSILMLRIRNILAFGLNNLHSLHKSSSTFKFWFMVLQSSVDIILLGTRHTNLSTLSRTELVKQLLRLVLFLRNLICNFFVKCLYKPVTSSLGNWQLSSLHYLNWEQTSDKSKFIFCESQIYSICGIWSYIYVRVLRDKFEDIFFSKHWRPDVWNYILIVDLFP